jgi:glutamine synthetase
VLEVVREAFKETGAVRFEGNNYSDDWVVEAKKRKLLNLRRTPEALAQLLTKESRAVLTKLGILSKPELESRFHVRLERYVKDMLIEIHTLEELIDTMVFPAAFAYLAMLTESAADAKAAGIKVIPQVDAANQIGALIAELQMRRTALGKVTAKAEGMHEDLEAQAKLLTADGADRMADVRESSDALELVVSDDLWPLPKYREMLFPL